MIENLNMFHVLNLKTESIIDRLNVKKLFNRFKNTMLHTAEVANYAYGRLPV